MIHTIKSAENLKEHGSHNIDLLNFIIFIRSIILLFYKIFKINTQKIDVFFLNIKLFMYAKESMYKQKIKLTSCKLQKSNNVAAIGKELRKSLGGNIIETGIVQK